MRNKKLSFCIILSIIVFHFSSGQTNGWLWENKMGGGALENGCSIITDSIGNVYVTGTFQSDTIWYGTTQLINTETPWYDIFVAKFDVIGNLVWLKSGGGNGSDYVKAITLDKNGNIFITGSTLSDSIFLFDGVSLSMQISAVFLLKIDNNGSLVWGKFSSGSGYCGGNGIVTDLEGNVYVTGFFEGPINFGNLLLVGLNLQDIFIVKYDQNGNPIWVKSIVGSESEYSYSISYDTYGNLYLCGSYGSQSLDLGSLSLTGSNFFLDAFIAKYDTAGNVLWAKTSLANSYVYGLSTACDQFGNCYFAGRYANTVTFGSTTLYPVGGHGMFLVKYSANGTVLWVKGTGQVDSSNGIFVATDGQDNVYATGGCVTNINFGNSIHLDSANVGDIFVVKYSNSGIPLWAASAAGYQANANSISVDEIGNCFLTGRFERELIFGSDSLMSSGEYDLFIAKLSYTVGLADINNLAGDLQIFPNPSLDQFVICSKAFTDKTSLIEIFNTLGEKIYSAAYRDGSTVNCEHFPPGIYFVRLSDSEKQLTQKLVVE